MGKRWSTWTNRVVWLWGKSKRSMFFLFCFFLNSPYPDQFVCLPLALSWLLLLLLFSLRCCCCCCCCMYVFHIFISFSKTTGTVHIILAEREFKFVNSKWHTPLQEEMHVMGKWVEIYISSLRPLGQFESNLAQNISR